MATEYVQQHVTKWLVFKYEYFQSLHLDLNWATTEIQETSHSEETPHLF